MSGLYNKTIVLLCFLCASLAAQATVVGGKVTDAKSQPVPFANVYIKGTTNGTTTNAEGVYTLNLQPGNYVLGFSMIGYKQVFKKITVGNHDLQVNVELHSEQVQLNTVTVSASDEDPAYRIIRKVIAKRKFYLHQVKAYSCKAYTKSVQRLAQGPDKIMGININIKDNMDSASGIFYLSESVSKFNFEQPGKFREQMISSKVSGSNKAFSYNQASDLLFNFYQNVLQVPALSSRGFISPISNTALLSYRYKLLGSFNENGHIIDEIKVIPKRSHDPVFRGEIYVMEDGWRLYNVDLSLTRAAGINYLDTFRVRQSFLPVAKDIWMPFSNKYTFNFSFFGFKGNGVYVGVFSNYNLDPKFPKHFFNGQELKIMDGSNKKDSAYWDSIRPIPLTAIEKVDYHRRDSVMVVHESKEYLDSIDHVKNKLKFSNIFLGYHLRKRYKKESFTISPLIDDVGFNTVQGWYAGVKLGFDKRNEDTYKRLQLGGNMAYGFSNQRFTGGVHASYRYLPEKFGTVSVSAGSEAAQFNGSNPIGGFLNSLYTLFEEQNYAKLYEKDFVKASHRIELVNGVMLTIGVEYADRSPLFNTSNYTLVDYNNRAYTPNNPYDSSGTDVGFKRSQAFNINATLRLRIKQNYYSLPHRKYIIGSKYPTLIINYKKSIPGVFGSDMDYDLLKLGLTQKLNFKMLGRGEYLIEAGKFLNTNKMQFMDEQHFMGNRTIYSTFHMNDYNLLDYYAYSTSGEFFEAHYEHNFGGLIFNKFPLLRKLKMNTVAGYSYLATDQLKNYSEISIGVKRLFARIDFVMSFEGQKQLNSGICFGLSF